MMNYVMVVLLGTTVTVAQTTPQSNQKANTDNTTAQTSAGSPAGSAKPNANSAENKPLPEHSLKTKLRQDNTVNPNYNREKEKKGRGAKREYPPRLTESGARADTMNQRRPGQQ